MTLMLDECGFGWGSAGEFRFWAKKYTTTITKINKGNDKSKFRNANKGNTRWAEGFRLIFQVANAFKWMSGILRSMAWVWVWVWMVVVVVGGGIVLRAGRSADAARTGSQWQRGLSEELNTCTWNLISLPAAFYYSILSSCPILPHLAAAHPHPHLLLGAGTIIPHIYFCKIICFVWLRICSCSVCTVTLQQKQQQ